MNRSNARQKVHWQGGYCRTRNGGRRPFEQCLPHAVPRYSVAVSLCKVVFLPSTAYCTESPCVLVECTTCSKGMWWHPSTVRWGSARLWACMCGIAAQSVPTRPSAVVEKSSATCLIKKASHPAVLLPRPEIQAVVSAGQHTHTHTHTPGPGPRICSAR